MFVCEYYGCGCVWVGVSIQVNKLFDFFSLKKARCSVPPDLKTKNQVIFLIRADSTEWNRLFVKSGKKRGLDSV